MQYDLSATLKFLGRKMDPKLLGGEGGLRVLSLFPPCRASNGFAKISGFKPLICAIKVSLQTVFAAPSDFLKKVVRTGA